MFEREEPPLDGIYLNIPEEEYHNWDCFSYSMVKPLNRSMKHLDLWMKEGSQKLKNKKNVTSGNLVECLALEPELFNSKFEFYPETCKKKVKKETMDIPFTLSTDDGKEIRDKILNSGKLPITKEMYENAKKAVSALEDNEFSFELLFKGTRQLSIVWTDKSTNVKCKCRLDNLNEIGNSIADLKTTFDAYYPVFIKTIGNMGWHVQGGSYQQATEYFYNDVFSYTIIGVEPEYPFGVTCITLREDSLTTGLNEFRKALNTYSLMLKIKPEEYTCYNVGIIDSDIPAYMLKANYEEEESIDTGDDYEYGY